MRITLLAGTLRTRLAETRQADSHHHYRLCYVRGPEGIIVELAENRLRAQERAPLATRRITLHAARE